MSVVVEEIAGNMPLILILRKNGFSLRTIAKGIGVPKSTLARYMPAIVQEAAEIRLRLEHGDDSGFGPWAGFIADQVSHLGSQTPYRDDR